MEENPRRERKRSWKTNEQDLVEKMASQGGMTSLFKAGKKSSSTEQDLQQQVLHLPKPMVSIFHDEREYNLQYGTKFWKRSKAVPGTFCFKGHFSEEFNGDVVSDREYFINGDSLFYYEDKDLRELELTFTIVEQKLYLRNYKKIFALRFSNNGNLTQLYTTNQETFINFYTQLSSLCILTNFQEHYRVKGQLGKGHFSIVYEGQNSVTKKVVALKCYNKVLMKQKQGGVQLVKNEIRNLQYLKLFHISPLMEIFETIDAVVLVQHKAQAGDMLRYLSKQETVFNEQMIKTILKQIIDKVALLHKIGFIHRDLKPENILFRAEEPRSPLYLSDLGLTVRKEQLSQKKIMHYSCGTLGFVAPEVLKYVESEPCYNEQCDVFSVGCIFYFLHTGTPLFVGRNKRELYLKNRDCKEIEEKLRALDQIAPQGIELMRRLLCVDPQVRITAEEACKSPYFSDLQPSGQTQIIFGDTSMDTRNLIINKVEKYWSQYRGKIS